MKYVLTPAVLCTMLACSTEPDTMGALPSSPMPSDKMQQLAAGGPAPAGTGGQGGTGGSPSIAGRAGSAGHAGSAGLAGSVPSSAGTGGLGGSSGVTAAGTGGTGGAGGAGGSSGTGGTDAAEPVLDPTQPFCKLDKPVDNYGDFWGCDMLDGWKPTTTAHSMIVWWIEFDKYGTPVRETSQGCQSNYDTTHVPCPIGMPCQLVLTYGPGVGTQLKYDGTCQ